MRKYLMVLALISFPAIVPQAVAQTSVPFNEPEILGGDPPFNFLGWESTVATDLDITHHTPGQINIPGHGTTTSQNVLLGVGTTGNQRNTAMEMDKN